MRVVLFILLIIALAAVNAEVGGSSALKAPATARALKRAKAVKESPVQVVGAAVKAAPAFDGKAALQLATTFAIWYGFNAAYNVYNAFVKKDFKYPWTTSTLQLMVGLVYALPLWGFKVRDVPKINKDDLMKLLPIAGLNAFGHTAAVIAMFEKGGGSFTHVIKASEPVVSTALNFAINKVVPKPFTALSLLPITYGVAYASTLGNLNPAAMTKEFTTKAAKMAMCSNVGFALRSILRKNLPGDFKSRTGLDPANEHAVTTALSAALMIPFVLMSESIPDMMDTFNAMGDNKGTFLTNLFLCGMSFYMYNEMQNKVLGALGPVPTAVGNTLKRVVIFVALYFFTSGESFPPAKVLGCAIAIAGCLSYAICNSKKI